MLENEVDQAVNACVAVIDSQVEGHLEITELAHFTGNTMSS